MNLTADYALNDYGTGNQMMSIVTQKYLAVLSYTDKWVQM